MPTYVLLKGFPEYAAANIADAQNLFTALLDPDTEANALAIGKYTGRLPPLCVADTSVPLVIDSIDDAAGTRSSWVTNATASLAFAIGDADPALSHRYASANVSNISSNTRVGNIVLATSNLVSALQGSFGYPIRGTSTQFTAHIQQTDALGFTQTYGLLPLTVNPGVFSGTVADIAYLNSANTTGTGNVVLSASPTFTGTAAFGNIAAAGNITAATGLIGAGSLGGSGGTSRGSVAPLTLYAKSVTILTSGVPADIATITVPAGITRYFLLGGISADAPNVIVSETGGDKSVAAIGARSASAGGGVALLPEIGPPSTNGVGATWASEDATGTIYTNSTIYLRQTGASANAGTVSFYITIFPLP